MNTLFTLLCIVLTFGLFGQDSTLNKREIFRDDVYGMMPFSIYGQTSPIELNPGSASQNIMQADFQFFNQSTSIRSDVSRALLFNKYVKPTSKDKSLNAMKEQNVYGDGFGGSFTYQHRFKPWKPNYQLRLCVAYTYANNRFLQFHQDAFHFAFYGNKWAENDTISLSPLSFKNLSYNRFQAGVIHELQTPKHRFEFGYTFSLLQGPQYLELSTSNSKLFTAEYGEYLFLNYNLQLKQANQGAPKFFDPIGLGFAGDAQFTWMQKSKNGTGINRYLRVVLNDAGFIQWRKETTQYNGDSALVFRGIDVTDLVNEFQGTILDSFNTDSLLKILSVNKSTQAFQTTLPFRIALIYGQSLLNGKGLLSCGLEYRYAKGYMPLGWIRFGYAFKYGIQTSVSIASGGYMYYNLGVELSKRFTFGYLTLGSAHIPGLIHPASSTSSSLYVRLGATF